MEETNGYKILVRKCGGISKLLLKLLVSSLHD